VAEPASVLIVEDEPGTASMYQIVLEVEGYRTRVAYTATQAMRMLDGEVPDLVLLDVVLRGTSGLEFCRFLRKQRDYAEIPVVMISVRNTPDDVRQGLEAGADFYLAKPVSQEELLEVVRRGLAQRRASNRPSS
jgi:two-component system phosphate regulon response regulator PhoB